MEGETIPTRGPHQQGAWGVRILSHAAIWATLLVPVQIRMARGWRPVWDDAYIALTAHQVFSSQSPLLGGWSSTSEGAGHTLHDLGPLLFWLLAIPVRIDPAQGVLWGAAVWCAVMLSVSAEAAWSVRGWPACAAVAISTAGLLWIDPSVFAHIVWNPNAGLVFLMATLVLAWCVGAGALGWWPVLVFAGSLAAQCHLIFAANALGLVVVAPVLGLLSKGRKPGGRWLVIGFGVGVVCWMAPLIQQLTGNPGNVTLLLQSGGHQPTLGIGFGFRLVGDAGAVPPIWLSHFPTIDSPAGLIVFRSFLYAHSAIYGAVVLVVGAGIAVWAWRSGRRALASLAIVTCLSLLCVAFSIARVPAGSFLVLGYLAVYVWVVGMAWWACVVWAGAELLRTWLPHLGWRPSSYDAIARRASGTAAALGIIVVITTAVVAEVSVRGSSTLVVATSSNARVRGMTAAVEREVSRGPVRFELLPSTIPVFTRWTYETAIDWQLTADGWQTGLPLALHEVSAFSPPKLSWPTVIVTLQSTGRVSAVRIHSAMGDPAQAVTSG